MQWLLFSFNSFQFYEKSTYKSYNQTLTIYFAICNYSIYSINWHYYQHTINMTYNLRLAKHLKHLNLANKLLETFQLIFEFT